MTAWKAANGHILWFTQPDTYVEIDPTELAIRGVYSRGESGYEDDWYEWSFFLEGEELRKRFSTTRYSEEPEVRLTVQLAGLQRLTGAAAERWEHTARELLDEREGRAREQADTQRRSDEDRERSFLRALPPSAPHLVFRAADKGWCVALRGEDEPFWTDDQWRWRGKDLHHQLRRVLLRAGKEFESFTTELATEDDDRCYHGE